MSRPSAQIHYGVPQPKFIMAFQAGRGPIMQMNEIGQGNATSLRLVALGAINRAPTGVGRDKSGPYMFVNGHYHTRGRQVYYEYNWRGL